MSVEFGQDKAWKRYDECGQAAAVLVDRVGNNGGTDFFHFLNCFILAIQ
jgi:hypothetical protein